MKRLLACIVLPFAFVAVSCSTDSVQGETASEEAVEDPVASDTEAVAAPTDPALAACATFVAGAEINKELGKWKTSLPQPPVFPFDADKSYYWNIETNHGNVKVRLMPETAPMHASSTIYLSTIGFYDDLTFHRIITDFMAQGGCPQGTGTEDPGFEYAGEFDANVKHDRPGLLSMANSGPGTDGSQFFLTFKATPWLNGKHTIFGEVVDGMDAIKSLESIGTRSGTPTGPANMVKTTITVE
ncbi:MAG TPA: peptidylprolyl isomerase [Gemmatimonadetes bacterium]|nr:peptidylprolyl isomerase [Gemmatimonadota bacterium]